MGIVAVNRLCYEKWFLTGGRNITVEGNYGSDVKMDFLFIIFVLVYAYAGDQANYYLKYHIMGVRAEVYSNTGDYTLDNNAYLYLEIILTDEGLRNVNDILLIINKYINIMKSEGYKQKYFDDFVAKILHPSADSRISTANTLS